MYHVIRSILVVLQCSQRVLLHTFRAKMQNRPLNSLLRLTKGRASEATSISVEGGSRLSELFLDWDAYLGPTLLFFVSELNKQ